MILLAASSISDEVPIEAKTEKEKRHDYQDNCRDWTLASRLQVNKDVYFDMFSVFDIDTISRLLISTT